MPRRLTATVSALAVAGALLLAGCGEEEAGPSSSTLGAVTVTGEAKKEPTVKVKTPLTVSRTESKVLSEGDGAAIAKDDLVTLQAVLVNGKDGKVATSTWKSGTVGLDLGSADLFKSFKSQIPGKKIGSRLLITSTPADAYGDTGNQQIGIAKDDPVVFVLDLLGTTKVLAEAQGTAVAPKKGLPTVAVEKGKPATITPPKGVKAPTKTVVQPLITGEGAAVKAGQTVRVAYTGALYRNGEVFDSSASRPEQPYFEFVLGQGQVIKGWDAGLVGQKVGSRVLLVIPPADGYGEQGSGDKIKGTDTLVFSVDILAAY
ncbi:FKBP-type peptidyl-prolyl cis-trans isomerase [Phycicoccus avicenniae]|uniref:FKBP-type peptidyl-prolyl cis-trans isomerase n=1 Tax=Phycicoccus avicenniae TaxID=2828860 RepID=UPI003D28113D